METISIPTFKTLGAYAEDYPEEIEEFAAELFGSKEPVEIIDCDPFYDMVEVGLTMEWFDGENLMLAKDSVELYGSTQDFRIAATFSVNGEDRRKWAEWCIKHCGHWALRGE